MTRITRRPDGWGWIYTVHRRVLVSPPDGVVHWTTERIETTGLHHARQLAGPDAELDFDDLNEEKQEFEANLQGAAAEILEEMATSDERIRYDDRSLLPNRNPVFRHVDRAILRPDRHAELQQRLGEIRTLVRAGHSVMWSGPGGRVMLRDLKDVDALERTLMLPDSIRPRFSHHQSWSGKHVVVDDPWPLPVPDSPSTETTTRAALDNWHSRLFGDTPVVTAIDTGMDPRLATGEDLDRLGELMGLSRHARAPGETDQEFRARIEKILTRGRESG